MSDDEGAESCSSGFVAEQSCSSTTPIFSSGHWEELRPSSRSSSAWYNWSHLPSTPTSTSGDGTGRACMGAVAGFSARGFRSRCTRRNAAAIGSTSLLFLSALAALLWVVPRQRSHELEEDPAQMRARQRYVLDELGGILKKEEIGGPGLEFPISFELDAVGYCPKGWTCTGPAAVCKVGSDQRPCRPYPGIQGHDGQHYLDIGNDYGTATAASPSFILPDGVQKLCFRRSGGADNGSGLYLVRKSDGRTICAAENGKDTNEFFTQCCNRLHDYQGQEVFINIADTQSSGWGKVLIDDLKLLDAEGRVFKKSKKEEKMGCAIVQENLHYDGLANIETLSRPSAEACCTACQERLECDAWGWGKVRNNWLTDKCFLKKLTPGANPIQVAWPGVTSGLPAKSMLKVYARLFNASEYVEQSGAEFQPGSELRLYALGSSSMLWMNWIEELHLYLLRLGYILPTVAAKVKPEFHPRSIPTCDDSMYFDRLATARFARIGWCSWDYAFEGWDDCDSDGYRIIGGQKVKCQHGPGCSHSRDPLMASDIAVDAGMSDITLIATWFNDDQQRWSDYHCFSGKKIEKVDATKLSIPSLLQTVRKIHKQNPKVWVVILGKYPQVWGHFTYPWFQEVNIRVKAALAREPRTIFIDYYIPPDNVTNLYQSAHPGHPNCRGSKLIALAVLRKLFEEGVIGRNVYLQVPTEKNIVRAPCQNLTIVECHTSVVCWIDPADGRCKVYSRGSDDAHAIIGL